MATNSTHDDSDSVTQPKASQAPPDAKTAADLIREKVSRIYDEAPSVEAELTETLGVPVRSKHQQFMYDLSTSGKDLAAVQTEWHNYYQKLSDREKHKVWQEFYASQPLATTQPSPSGDSRQAQLLAKHKQESIKTTRPRHSSAKKPRDKRRAHDVQAAIRDKVTAGGKLETKHHLQSLLFGLGLGLTVVIIFLFGFFNEVIISPFIQPSRVASATPLIIDNNSVAPTATPEVIIPKINVQIPVDYNQSSINETTIENALESGVVHYPTTVRPGQNGNTALFGHSSNNIFNKGKYKFAFVLLRTLVVGDTFYLTYQDKVYVYKVISRTIVDPSNVGVLGPVAGKTATATLITCDPPGTSLHRLIVVGEQISPDVSGNSTGSAPNLNDNTPSSLPGNGPTLLSRVMRTWVGKTLAVCLVVGVSLLVLRRLNRSS